MNKRELMKKSFQIILIFASLSGLAHANDLFFKKEKENSFKYFSSEEEIQTLYIADKSEDAESNKHVFLFNAKPKQDLTVTICADIFEITQVKNKLLSSDKTVYYNNELINATKIKSIWPASTEELAQLGLDKIGRYDIGKLELTDGTNLFVADPSSSTYRVCGKKSGENFAGEKLVAEHYFTVLTKTCLKQAKKVIPSLGSSRGRFSYFYGEEAKYLFDECIEKENGEIIKIKEIQEVKERAIKEDNDRFEEEKKRHKMIPGIQILGDIGVVRAKDLAYRCLHYNFLTDGGYTKRERKNYKCDSYYEEEVQDLQREMRIRGLVSD